MVSGAASGAAFAGPREPGGGTGPPEPSLRWPPPGLERIQGDLWRIAGSAALAALLVVVPALVAVGLAFSLDAFVRLARLLRRTSRAVERGYEPVDVVRVAADARRDMGFLLQGERHFSVLDRRERDVVDQLRRLTPILLAAGGLWLQLALGLGLVAAARGWVGPGELRALVLLPALGAYGFGVVTWLTEDRQVRAARRAWHERSWVEDLDPERIHEWRIDAVGPGPVEAPGPPDAGGAEVGEADGDPLPRRLRRVALAANALTLLAVVPILMLLPAAAVGPILDAVAVPAFETAQRRAAALEAYRDLRLPGDPAVTAVEAGRLLHNLLFVGSDRAPAPGELPPPLRIDRPWLSEGTPGAPALPPARWPQELFALAEGADAGLAAWLASAAAHPARADLSRLARAERIDVASARWEDPFPEGTSSATVPLPPHAGLREGAQSHLAAAAGAMLAGRLEEAEMLLREIVSVGFLLADDGPTLLDNLFGQALVRDGGTALARFFEASGQDARARELERAAAVAERAAARIPGLPDAHGDALFARLPRIVLDPTIVRGVRWEAFTLASTVAPCADLRRVVFGPGADQLAFVREARAALVRWPSEEALFALSAAGFFGGAGEPSWVGRVLALPMRTGEGTCGRVFERIEALRALS